MMAPHKTPPRVLIARPGARAQALRTALERVGFSADNLGIMRLEPQPLAPSVLRWLDEEGADTLLCVSPFAVECLAATLSPLPAWHERVELIATGASTREALATAFGRRLADVQEPLPGYRAASEGVLALPSLQAVAGRQIAIACGENGRPLLRDQLQARGAAVHELRLYKRYLLAPSTSLAQALMAGEYAALVITSVEQLDHIGQWCSRVSLANPLVVSSQRLAEKAKAKGFERVMSARDATPQALAACCARLVLDE